MEWKQIRQLADKYWQAETTVEEEEVLKNKMSSSEHPDRDLQETEYFRTLHAFSHATLDDDFDERLLAHITDVNQDKPFFKQTWFQMAASIVLSVGIAASMGYSTYKAQRQQEARAAFELTKNALFMVSERLNRGTQYTIEGLEKIEETHQRIKTQNFKN